MRIHLIRHGEVDNPLDFVYGDIPGFGLSERGTAQAQEAGKFLAAQPPAVIVSSPLDRAVATAQLIAITTGSLVRPDERLTEWALAVRWRGATWAQLPTTYPGELEAYLANPRQLPFSPESIDDVSARMSAAVDDHTAAAGGDVAFVSHQDPIHAAHLHLVGAPPAPFHDGKPQHCSITTLQRTKGVWRRSGEWSPPQ